MTDRASDRGARSGARLAPRSLAGAAARRLPTITPRAYQHLLTLALGLLGLIIVTGGIVRLTGSGLGCPQWPTCNNGDLLAAPTWHARIELYNRYLTGWIGVIVSLLGMCALLRRPYRRDLVRLSLWLWLGVVGQAVLGGLTVLFDLKPQIVMGHFLLSIVLLTVALVMHHRAGESGTAGTVLGRERRAIGTPALTTLGRLLVGTTAVAVVLGTVVTSSGPHGGDDKAERFAFSMRDVSRIHSLGVWLMATVAVLLAWHVRHGVGRIAVARRRVAQLLLVATAQGILGYVQYFNQVPPVLVGFHIFGATLVWAAALRVKLALSIAPGDPSRNEPSAELA